MENTKQKAEASDLFLNDNLSITVIGALVRLNIDSEFATEANLKRMRTAEAAISAVLRDVRKQKTQYHEQEMPFDYAVSSLNPKL